MSATSRWLLAGIAALAAAVAWRTCPTSDTSHSRRAPRPTSDTGSARPTSDTGQRNPERPAARPTSDTGQGNPERPARAAPPARRLAVTRAEPAPSAALADAFGAEPRDQAWAPGAEAALATRLDGMAWPAGAGVAAIECRERQCRLDVRAPDDAALGAALAALGEPGGL